MPTPTIPDGELFMNATLWTGNGTTQTITNGVAGQSFQPDLVWAKARSEAGGHGLFDSVRGTSLRLDSSTTNAESTSSGVTSFNSNGFSLGSVFNAAGVSWVGWQWKAGGAAVTNTAGSISSQVSANTTSGFSVVTWVDSASTYTVGHGLGVAPQFIILKDRSNTYNWDVGCNPIGWANRLKLNDTSATSAGYWNSTAPTSSVFTYIGNGTGNMVAYCWTPIAGYSAFGSYTGNGSADGPFVYTGFRPRFVMWKRSDSTGDWIIFDTSRDTYNYADKQLVPNSSAAEQVTGGGFVRMDFLSNGFKIRSTDSYINANGGTYIYMAFAENPFKYSLAR
jgi:Tfp pilus assembly protein PilV